MSYNLCTVLLHCGILLLCFMCVQLTEEFSYNAYRNHLNVYNRRFSLWPSIHNAASSFLRNRLDVLEQKDPAKSSVVIGTEGCDTISNSLPFALILPAVAAPKENNKTKEATEKTITQVKPNKPINNIMTGNATDSSLSPTHDTSSNINVAAKINDDTTKPTANDTDLYNPGVLKRSFIVFGGFLFLGVAFFMFYKRKVNNNASNDHCGTIDTNKFKYEVLQSEDRSQNIELSRVSLTMESDDDKEKDLEIFDLKQKKKSLSHVNLTLTDENIVLRPSEHKNDNLLLDDESTNLLSWSSNTNYKSIL